MSGLSESSASPRWSVLLPTHDGLGTLRAAVASVLAQSETDFELLLVGDGCTDGTAEWVATVDDPRLRWFDLPKAPGFGYANRSTALRTARAERIAYMAHDDLWAPDHLAQLGAALDDTPADWACTRPLWQTPDGLLAPLPVDLADPARVAEFLDRFNEVPAVCVAFTRSALQAAGGWPEDVESAGDWELWKRILAVSAHPPLAVPVVSSIHFRAGWRTRDTRSVERLAELSQRPEFWPDGLRVPGSGADRAQQATLEAQAGDPAGWWAGVRAATRVLDARLGSLGMEVPGLEHRIFALDDIIEEVRSSNGRLNGSIDMLSGDLKAAQTYIRRLEDDLAGARAYIEQANAEITRLRADADAPPPE